MYKRSPLVVKYEYTETANPTKEKFAKNQLDISKTIKFIIQGEHRETGKILLFVEQCRGWSALWMVDTPYK